ncbi:DNA-methyltransferase [Sphingomonas tabacisoli]|uniref:Methyltransferase n=1 Tax=Sphingomonas tabacisoli TaxID=2249466 RepID=A0ABW4I6J6_9SPHN
MNRRDAVASFGVVALQATMPGIFGSEDVPQKALKLSSEQYDLTIERDFSERYLAKGSQFEVGKLSTVDCLEWLSAVPDQSVDLVFADPPYNIGKASWDSFESHDIYVDWCLSWIKQSARVLKPTGSLMVCGFTEIVADVAGPARSYFSYLKWLIWHYKNKANLGKDFGRSHESIVHLRHKDFALNVDAARIPYGQHTLKYPSHPQADSSDFARDGKKHVWNPNPLGAKPKDVIEIPTISNGMAEKTPHPTQKPEELLRKLIVATSQPGDMILDPFSGSGTTAVTAEQLGRKWAACDLDPQYNRWAADRLAKVKVRDEAYWMEQDRVVALRRESIR